MDAIIKGGKVQFTLFFFFAFFFILDFFSISFFTFGLIKISWEIVTKKK